MRFQRGIKGFAIVIVALMITTVAGYALSAEETVTQVKDYEPFANISGLYDYDKTPQYVDYNPASNITGYYNEDTDIPMDGVIFSTLPEGQANMYPIVQNPTKQDVTTDSITGLNLTQKSPPTGVRPYYKWGIVWDDPTVSIKNAQIHPETQVTLRPAVTSLINLISHFADFNTADIIDYSFTTPVYLNVSGWSEQREVVGSTLTYYYTVNAVSDKQVAALHYNHKINTITADFTNGTSSMLGDPALIDLCYSGESTDPIFTNLKVLGNSANHTALTYPDPVYMDPSKGVMLENIYDESGKNVCWKNGYENVACKITYNFPQSSINTFFDFELSNGLFLEINLSHGSSTSGEIEAEISEKIPGHPDRSLAYISFYLDSWKSGIITLDIQNGILKVTPCNSFVDFNNFKTYPDISPNPYSDSDEFFKKLKMDATFSKAYIEDPNSIEGELSTMFQITDTRAFLNTYGSVMKDPSISIDNYYPELTDYRLDYRSFALYGESITINNVVYPVTNGTVQIVADGPVHELQNISIYRSAGNTALKFNNDNAEYDLGATVDDTVAFTGVWYFENDLYNQFIKDVKEYNFDFKTFGLDSAAFIMMFLGILAVGAALIMKKGGGLSGVDLGIMAIAAVVGLTIVGVI